MRQILMLAFLLASISSFSQGRSESNSGTKAKMDSVASSPVKHDTAYVTIRTVYDTPKVKFYYEDGDNLKVYHNGFLIRGVQTNSLHPDQNQVISVLYYDEKMRLFKKPAFNPQAR